MNKVILTGRLAKDPTIKYINTVNGQTANARYSLAVDRRYKKDGEQSADFISCVAFGKIAETAEKYLKKGMKIAVVGRLQTGSYTNKQGVKVYTTDVMVEEQEFLESKNGNTSSTSSSTRSKNNSGQENRSSYSSSHNGDGNQYQSDHGYSYGQRPSYPADEGFMNIPENAGEDMPFI